MSEKFMKDRISEMIETADPTHVEFVYRFLVGHLARRASGQSENA